VTEWRGPRTIYNTWIGDWGPGYESGNWGPGYDYACNGCYGGYNYPVPWAEFPPVVLPPVTIDYPSMGALPAANCVLVPMTYYSDVLTMATYTSTITQPPPSAMVTVYLDPDTNSRSTDWGNEWETVFEVYVYTTTAHVDVISSTAQC
jgi:hypothetical protein